MADTRQVAQLTREELYERIWTTPMRHLAKEFGISNVVLAKICEEPVAFLAWARAQANRIDPLADSPASILDEKEKWSRGWYW
jgi:hypothetical protein